MFFLTWLILLPQDLCEHSTAVSSRSGGLSPSSLSASQSSEILGVAREAAQAKAGCSQNACGVEDVLQLLRILYIIGGDSASNVRSLQEGTRTHTHQEGLEQCGTLNLTTGSHSCRL